MFYVWKTSNFFDFGTPVDSLDELYRKTGKRICIVDNNDIDTWKNINRDLVDKCIMVCSEDEDMYIKLKKVKPDDVIIWGSKTRDRIHNPFFFYRLQDLYRNTTVNNRYSGDIVFNCLLGDVNPQRTYVYYKCLANNMMSKNVITYRPIKNVR